MGSREIIQRWGLASWDIIFYEKLFSWLVCLPPIYPLLYVLNSFFACNLPVPLITPCSNNCVCSTLYFDLLWFLFTVLMYTMTGLLYRSAVLTIFMPITCFQRLAWSDLKNSLLLTKNNYFKKNLVPYNEVSSLFIEQNVEVLRWNSTKLEMCFYHHYLDFCFGA